jgi:hypothetical protein
MITFAGLRSRWMTPPSCAAATPAASCRAIDMNSPASSGRRRIRCVSVSPSQYSMTMKGTPSGVSPTS